MNQTFFPDDSLLEDLFSFKAFETPSIVQFIHRNIAYFIILLFGFISFIIYRDKNLIYLRNITSLLCILIFFQATLGVFTVLSGAQIIIASMHQIGSIFLITASVILAFKNFN